MKKNTIYFSMKSKGLSMIAKPLFVIILLVFICGANNSYGQGALHENTEHQDTSVVFVKKHSAKKASIYSAIVPGLGQVYNKKYWKVPLIYAGFIGLAYAFENNQKGYSKFKTAYAYRMDEDSTTIDEFANNTAYTPEYLKATRDDFRKYRDLSVIGMVGLYFLNIVDASVDAHLFDYDVSDDLTLRVQPVMIKPKNHYQTFGLRCSISF